MELLNLEQQTEALPLYEALKAENGVYYARLKDNGWASAFEKVIY